VSQKCPDLPSSPIAVFDGTIVMAISRARTVEPPLTASDSQGGAQQGTGARGEQYLDGLARSRKMTAPDLFSNQITLES
jgi:hypothetical protein